MMGARFLTVVVLSLLSAAAWADEVSVTDGEVWNRGVDFYRAGDVTNALQTLKPLLLSKSHGARAAEVVAKLEYERGDLEAAAAAAQIALRARPDDEKAGRNFSRAVAHLPEARETAHINAVLKEAEGQDPGAMLERATAEARRLFDEASGFRTNRADRAVQLADALSKRAEKIADVWIPVRELIVRSVTNETQAATILDQVAAAQTATKRAAREFADLDAESFSTMAEVEGAFTRFFKLTALPPAAVAADLEAQSNAWQDVESRYGRAWQADALDYTRAFRAKFPAWARAYEQQAQADTNRPPFTAEDQAKISALATELEKLQLECAEKPLPPQQERAVKLLQQIQALLPKDSGGQGGNSSKDQQQNQGQQQNQEQQSSENQQQNGQDEQQTDERQQESPEEATAEEEKEGEAREEEKSADDKEVEALLRKAQERNDEHEEDKRRLMRRARLPPNEKDW